MATPLAEVLSSETGKQVAASTSGSAIGSLFSGMFNLIGDTIQSRRNERAVKEARQFALDTWNMQNEYDSPKEQINRLREAGLNPLSASIANNPSQAVGQPAPPSYSNPLAGVGNSFAGLGSNFQSAVLADKQANLMEAQARALNADANEKEQTLPLKVQALGQDIELRFNKDQREAERQKAELQKLQQDMVHNAESNLRDWKRLSIEQQAQFLNEQTFAFRKWVESSQLTLDEKRVMCDLFNAGVNQMLAESKIKVDAQTVINLDKDGQLLDQRIKQSEFDTEHQAELFRQNIRNMKVSNITSCINSGANVVNAVANGVKAFVGIGGVSGANTGLQPVQSGNYYSPYSLHKQ